MHDWRARARSQAVRYAARLRAADANAVAIVHVAGGGHHGEGGRRLRLEQIGLEYSFLGLALGLDDLRAPSPKPLG